MTIYLVSYTSHDGDEPLEAYLDEQHAVERVAYLTAHPERTMEVNRYGRVVGAYIHQEIPVKDAPDGH